MQNTNSFTLPVPVVKYCHTTEGVKNLTMSKTMGWLTKKGPSIVVRWSCRFDPTFSKARTTGTCEDKRLRGGLAS